MTASCVVALFGAVICQRYAVAGGPVVTVPPSQPPTYVMEVDDSTWFACANPMDLQGKTLRFRPSNGGTRSRSISCSSTYAGTGAFQLPTRRQSLQRTLASVGWAVVPFWFSTARVEPDGLSTRAATSRSSRRTGSWPHRDPFADGTMRSVAAAIDSQAAAGFGHVAPCGRSTQLQPMRSEVRYLESGDAVTPDRHVVTWSMTRPVPSTPGTSPPGGECFRHASTSPASWSFPAVRAGATGSWGSSGGSASGELLATVATRRTMLLVARHPYGRRDGPRQHSSVPPDIGRRRSTRPGTGYSVNFGHGARL